MQRNTPAPALQRAQARQVTQKPPIKCATTTDSRQALPCLAVPSSRPKRITGPEVIIGEVLADMSPLWSGNTTLHAGALSKMENKSHILPTPTELLGQHGYDH